MQKLVLLDDLLDGMVLALPVKNKFGQVLLAADVKLEGKHKNLFRTWGIDSFYIIADSNEEGEEAKDEKVIAEARDLLSKRVEWKPKNENEEDIINLGLISIIEKLSK